MHIDAETNFISDYLFPIGLEKEADDWIIIIS